MYEGFASYKNRGLVVFIDLLRSVESIHNIDANVGKDVHMEIEDAPGLSFRFVKTASIDKLIDKCKYTGDSYCC